MSSVAQMIRAANPVVDPAAALADDEFEALLILTKRRSGEMDVKEVQRTETADAQRRSWRGVLVAAAVFAVIVGGAVAALVLSGGDSTPDVGSGTTIPLTGEGIDDEVLAAFTTVDQAYGAYNSGDMATWVAAGTGAEDFGEGTLANIVAWRQGEHAANARIDVTECRFVRRSPGVTIRFVFSCDTTTTNQLHGAAGMELAERYEWVIDADGTVVRSGSDHLRDGLGVAEDVWFAFPGQYLFWLLANHPDVYNQMEVVELLGSRQLTAASMPAALEYIDEYVATLP